MNQTLKIIHHRKSIRSFKNQAIEQDIVDQILEATLRSPTAGNMMLYSIIQVIDPELKKKLVTTCDNQPFIAKATRQKVVFCIKKPARIQAGFSITI
jgi:nitroreductase